MSDAEVIAFPGNTKLDIDPADVLDAAKANAVSPVLVLGMWNDGELYAAGSTSDMALLILLLEKFKHKVLSGDYGELFKSV